ncbi:MAG TPA: glycosyltransferase family 4 protein [Thermoanaerobaculia bacterium]|nr:glycosyltransferase family 4 protein [Thermoanaerobaculia bacterium]
MIHGTESSRERPRLLLVGDAVAPTGFARVMHNIIEPLKCYYEIHHLGTNYQGDPHGNDWKIYPAAAGGDLMGVRRLKPLVSTLRPKLVFLLNDIWVQGDYMEQLREFQPDLKVVMYCPLDMGPIDPRFVERLSGVDRFVTYTRFAKAQVESAVAEVKRRKSDFVFPDVEVIPHGVDTQVFHPLEDKDPRASRSRAIHAILGNDPRAKDAFIALNANRNQPRKRIDITLKGFALFAKNKPRNVLLYLHMGIEDAGWDVLRLSERYGLGNRLLLSSPHRQLPCIPVDKLNITYNAAAVGLNTSIGEGWGLANFEHAATRAAQIVPRHSAFTELWEGSGVLVDPVASLTIEKILWEGHLVSPEGVAEALERLYEDPVLLEELSAAAYRNATRPEYQWTAIARRWDAVFREALGREPEPAFHVRNGKRVAKSPLEHFPTMGAMRSPAAEVGLPVP